MSAPILNLLNTMWGYLPCVLAAVLIMMACYVVNAIIQKALKRGEHTGFALVSKCVVYTIGIFTERCGSELPVYLAGVSMGATTVHPLETGKMTYQPEYNTKRAQDILLHRPNILRLRSIFKSHYSNRRF